MEMINFQKVQFASKFAGLGNNETLNSERSIPTVNMVSGGIDTRTISIPVNRIDTLNRLQIQLGGLEDDLWHPITGQFLWYNNPVVGSATQLFIINSASSGNNLTINISRSNQTGGTIDLSAFTLRVKIRVMRPPFV